LCRLRQVLSVVIFLLRSTRLSTPAHDHRATAFHPNPIEKLHKCA